LATLIEAELPIARSVGRDPTYSSIHDDG